MYARKCVKFCLRNSNNQVRMYGVQANWEKFDWWEKRRAPQRGKKKQHRPWKSRRKRDKKNVKRKKRSGRREKESERSGEKCNGNPRVGLVRTASATSISEVISSCYSPLSFAYGERVTTKTPATYLPVCFSRRRHVANAMTITRISDFVNGILAKILIALVLYPDFFAKIRCRIILIKWIILVVH